MKNLKPSLKRFLLGSGAGLFCGSIAWSYSAYAHVSVSPLQAILGLLFMTTSCGVVAAIADIDALMERIPPF